MPNYQNGKIYKLWSLEGSDIYIGSTTLPLCQRKTEHLCKFKKGKGNSSKLLFQKYDDVRIELLEQYPCENKEELRKKEGEYIRNNECVNKLIAGRTQREYQEDNKEKIKEYKQEYYEKNKEKIKDRRKEYDKEYREDNKEKIYERNRKYRENNKEKIKERGRKYFENNKEKIKEYREKNREKIKEKQRENYEKNKNKINEKRREKRALKKELNQ